MRPLIPAQPLAVVAYAAALLMPPLALALAISAMPVALLVVIVNHLIDQH